MDTTAGLPLSWQKSRGSEMGESSSEGTPATLSLRDALAGNTSFSKDIVGLQLALDSTSLGAFKKCPRYYYYTILCGYEPKKLSHHLFFGLVYHGALERYDHGRSAGLPHDDCVDAAVKWLLEQTWSEATKRPWDSGDANKNRFTLLRTVVDYLDRFGENDSLETLQLDNGKPAVELSFTFFSGHHAGNGEPIHFCGHFDRVASMSGSDYIVDRKTTAGTISPSWFAQFNPHNQFSLYALAGRVVFKFPVQGVIVDGAQIAVGFSRFERAISPRTDAQLEEWHADAIWTMQEMERCARVGHWPMNDTSCDKYGGCAFRGICSKPPGARQLWLDSEFTRRVWDPLQRRGDV